MKQLAVYSLLFVMFLLAGCPLITKNSMDGGSYDVPSWMPGKWIELDRDGNRKNGYLFEKAEKKGNLKCYTLDSMGRITSADMRPVILSSLGNKVFLSAYSPADDMSEEGYYLFELRKVSNTEFQLAPVKEHAVEYDATPAEIKQFMEKNKDNKEMYDPTEVSRYKKL